MTHSVDQTVRLWSVATGQLAVPPLEHESRVNEAVFSGDGARVATATDSVAQVWDVRTGRPLRRPFVHPGVTWSVVFSPDGNSLLTTADDGVRIWDVSLDTRSLEDWRRVITNSSFAKLGKTLEQLAAPGRVLR